MIKIRNLAGRERCNGASLRLRGLACSYARFFRGEVRPMELAEECMVVEWVAKDMERWRTRGSVVPRVNDPEGLAEAVGTKSVGGAAGI